MPSNRLKDADESALEEMLFFEDVTGSKREPVKETVGQAKQPKRKASEALTEDLPVSVAKSSVWADSDNEVVDIATVARTRKLRRTAQETEITGEDYEQRLRQQFVSMHGSQSWAATKRDDASDSELELLERSTRSRLKKVVAQPIAFRKLTDVTAKAQNLGSGPIVSLAWQPTTGVIDNPLLASVALSDKGLVRVWRVGKEVELIASIQPDRRFRVSSVAFVSDRLLAMVGPQRGVLIFDVLSQKEHAMLPSVAGRADRKFFRLFQGEDRLAVLAEGNEVLVMDSRSLALKAALKINAQVAGVDFVGDSVYVADRLCSVYRFDSNTGKCLERVVDDRTVGVMSFAVNGRYCLLGSNSGTVDAIALSDEGQLLPINDKNIKSFERLTTPVDAVAFVDQDVFVEVSKSRANAMRACMLHNGHTLPGWPRNTDKFGMVGTLAVRDKLVAMGTMHGKIKLFQYRRVM